MLHTDLSKYMLQSMFNLAGSGFWIGNWSYAAKFHLLTGLPDEDNFQAVEANYQGYAPVTFTGVAGAMELVDGVLAKLQNKSVVAFPTCTDNLNQVITHFCLTFVSNVEAGGPKLVFAGELDAPLVCSQGYSPVFSAGALYINGPV